MPRLLPLTCLLFATPFPALAHIGHVAEVAGHGHLVAVGAMIAAAIVTGLIVKASKQDKQADTVEDDQDSADEETVGDTA